MESNGPWKIKSSENKYTNPWITVREDKVIRPDGKPGIFGVVTITEGVSVLAVDEHDTVYLTKEFHYALEQETLEVVSGGIEKGESPLQAAKRELQEELGILAGEWVDLGKLNPFTTVVRSPSYLFLAKKLEFVQSNQEGTETIKPVTMTLGEAVQQVLDSTITHGPSCVLILKAAKYLES